jgi:hypothetical protein
LVDPYLTLDNWWNLDISGMIYAAKITEVKIFMR